MRKISRPLRRRQERRRAETFSRGLESPYPLLLQPSKPRSTSSLGDVSGHNSLLYSHICWSVPASRKAMRRLQLQGRDRSKGIDVWVTARRMVKLHRDVRAAKPVDGEVRKYDQ
jgi:hypothetical protein